MLESKKVQEGCAVIFCISAIGEPTPDIMWMKNGKPLIKGRNMTTQDKDGFHTLIIENTGLTDAGIYSVTASNTFGEVASEASLDVYGKEIKNSLKENKEYPLFLELK